MFKNPSFLFDILCTVVWLVLAVRYARKGFLASIVQLTGNLISLLGARAFRCLRGLGVRALAGRKLPHPDRRQHCRRRCWSDLAGIAEQYAGFLPEAFRASIVAACERSIWRCAGR